MRTIEIMTKRDIERYVHKIITKRLKLLNRISRIPELGPKTLKDEDSVNLLALSVRAENMLHHHGIKTIGHLTAMTKRDLGRLRHCGLLSLNEIEARLAFHGWQLSDS